jgi:hypothetical protein
MDLKEIEKWVETTEGKKWLDGKKEGLIRKNEELIKELKHAGGGLSDTSLRLADVEKQLLDKQAELKRALLDIPLEKLLKENGVFEILIPQISRELCEIYDLGIKGNAGDMKITGTVMNENEPLELPMGDIVDTFLKTETGRQYVNPANMKTQIISTCLNVKGGDPSSKSLEGKTGRELAQMSDSDFQDAIKSMR